MPNATIAEHSSMSTSPTDPFTLLGLPREFEVDPRQLQAAYLKRSSALHPDRFPDPIVQAEVARQSAVINDARATLSNDEERANVLLTLLGGPTKEQDKSLTDGFLVEMMQVREEMEVALASDDPGERTRLEKWAQSQRQEYFQRIAVMFDEVKRAPNPSTLREIRRALNAWRYLERMIEQLDPDWRGGE